MLAKVSSSKERVGTASKRLLKAAPTDVHFSFCGPFFSASMKCVGREDRAYGGI